MGRRPQGSAFRALLVAVAVVVAALGAGWTVQAPAQDGTTSASSAVTLHAPTTPCTESPDEAVDDPARGEPARLVIPAIGVDASVVPIALTGDDELVPPSDVTRVGWWSDSAVPGSAAGTTLVTGHTVHAGGGVFDDLGDLERGDLVRVRTSVGWVEYRVTKVVDLRQDELEAKAARLFSQEVDGRLALVTCSHYRFGSYAGNTVVLAEPAGAG